MNPSFADLFRTGMYPPMCHPSADPAVNASVARAAGLDVPDPSCARILEIGCGTGHHILSLASRWPEARCTGVEVSAHAASRARNRMDRAGIPNVRIREVSILDFEPEETFDYIIAHGFFSWVEDEIKVGLMNFLGNHLAPSGIAVVSFNVVAGWRERMPVVAKARAISAAGDVDEMTALSVFREAADDEAEAAIIDDMLAKGAEVLAFDDFAPVMDAWSLGAFRKLAEENGLGWLGDSISGDRGGDSGDDAGKQTFRSEILCRADATFSEKPLRRAAPVMETRKVPPFPKLNPWRMLCVREGLPVPDADLRPCRFSAPQYLAMSLMDGSRSYVELAAYAKEQVPNLDFVSFLKHIAARGLFI